LQVQESEAFGAPMKRVMVEVAEEIATVVKTLEECSPKVV
jgi:hypothetical protein